MKCPSCSNEIIHHFVALDLAWCDQCRIAFSFKSLEDDEPTAILQLADASCCPKGVSYRRDEECESFSIVSFSFLGIPLALIAAGWLFITVFSFAIHVGIALLMLAVQLVITIAAIAALHNRISLAFFPKTGQIVYRKGPFRWCGISRKFNGKDVEEIREGALIVAEGELPRPVVFLRNGKSIMLDFSKNDEKREFMELALSLFITRS